MSNARSQQHDDLISLNERDFIFQAISEKKRIDGRSLFDYRVLKISFGSTWGRVQVQLGMTRVLFVVSCEVVKPYPDRPTEGFFKFNISFSPMASPAYGGRVSSRGVEIGRIVERGLRESGAIDSETLCIVAGDKVWSIRLDMHIIDDHGNLVDCCAIGSITALHHFRRPDVTISGDAIKVHSISEREPVPLSIHHKPICVTFGIFHSGELIVDPNWKEEQVLAGQMSITLNTQHELCSLQKSGGLPLPKSHIIEATKIAQIKVFEISKVIDKALEEYQLAKNSSKIGSLSDIWTDGFGLEIVQGEDQLKTNTIKNRNQSHYHPSTLRLLSCPMPKESMNLTDMSNLNVGSEKTGDYDSSSMINELLTDLLDQTKREAKGMETKLSKGSHVFQEKYSSKATESISSQKQKRQFHGKNKAYNDTIVPKGDSNLSDSEEEDVEILYPSETKAS